MQLVRTHRRRWPCYVVPAWEGLQVLHGFGTRNVPVAAYLNARSWWVPQTRQIHSDLVVPLDGPRVAQLQIGDAFITQRAQVLCVVRTADCLPILLLEPVRQVVGAVHAGWRGLAAGIIQHTLATMAVRYRIERDRLQAALGPCIGGGDYEVDAPVLDALHRQRLPVGDAITPTRPGHWLLDLRALARYVLQAQGILPAHIATSTLSTYRRPGEFHSYRRRPETHAGRQYSFIGLLGPGGSEGL